MDREDARQMFHMAVGLIALAALLVFGRGFMLAALFFTIVIGTLLMNARLLGNRIFIVQWFEERFEREDAPLPGWGSACYAAGVLLAASFLSDVPQIAAVIFVLGIGDGVSTIIGLRGRMKLPYNRKKTLEGTLAMFFASLGAFAFVGAAAIPLALIAALAESVPRVDDNLMIPAACAAFFLLAGAGA
jgi:dolichol kinase